MGESLELIASSPSLSLPFTTLTFWKSISVTVQNFPWFGLADGSSWLAGARQRCLCSLSIMSGRALFLSFQAAWNGSDIWGISRGLGNDQRAVLWSFYFLCGSHGLALSWTSDSSSGNSHCPSPQTSHTHSSLTLLQPHGLIHSD